jgi:hypothetical protein
VMGRRARSAWEVVVGGTRRSAGSRFVRDLPRRRPRTAKGHDVVSDVGT